ncbi:MAG: lectin MOA-related protein [Synechococcus sp.]
MTVRSITPEATTELFAQQVISHPEPGDHLKSYPDGVDKGKDTPEADAPEGEHFVVLSNPIPADQLDPATPYVVRDVYGRVLSINNAGAGDWEWAYFGKYASYPKDVLPLTFSADPTKGSAILIAQNGGLSWPLHANGKATSWEWTFWAKSGYDNGYPVMSLTARLSQTNPDGTQFYKLTWDNAGTTMSLCADSGDWNWLYVSSSKASEFTFHKFYVIKAKVDELFKATWPSASFVYSAFNTGDEFYEAITDAAAGRIYQNSGLRGYQWKPEVFDCDDFSYVYKAQASKDAYANAAEYGYAVGVIFGSTPTGAHAVNVFISPAGEVRILEPQTGDIVAGKDWKNDAGVAYSPYFVLM